MKRLFLVILVFILCSCLGCRNKTELEKLYEEVDHILPYYECIGIENPIFFHKQEIDKFAYEEIVGFFEVDFISHVTGKMSGRNIILAYEFENKNDAMTAFNNYFALEYPEMYVVIDNMIFIDFFPTYMWLDEEYQISDNYILSRTGTTLLYCYDKDNLIIPPHITEIAGSCCFGSYFENISFNDNLRTIRISAFFGSENLKSLIFNDGLEYIGRISFYNCCSLTNVVIPKSVKYIGSQAFNFGNIYCESESRPSGWKKDFAVSGAKVYWSGEWQYDDQGNPYSLVSDEGNDSQI